MADKKQICFRVTEQFFAELTAFLGEDYDRSTVLVASARAYMREHGGIPEIKTEKKVEKKIKKKCQLPADFDPDYEYAREHGLNPELAWEEFSEWARAKGALNMDWNLAWKRACRDWLNNPKNRTSAVDESDVHVDRTV